MNRPVSALRITGEFITLAQALKLIGLAGTGGQAKHLIRWGAVMVNGIVETLPGKKLHPGDRFGLENATECIISREENADAADHG